jgi:DNA-binding winged helix-turn-helix (wHTH) protein
MLNAELLSKVWGPEYVGDLQYLRVWVSRLRGKLEREPSEPKIIRTFQGVGYMLSADESQQSDKSDAIAPSDDEEVADEVDVTA